MYRNFAAFNSCFSGFGNISNGSLGGYIMMGIGLILVIAIVYLLVKKNNGRVNFKSEGTSPMETLQNRFVNGEIDENEFKRKKEILESK